ncbi:DUF397 domain-containing protein [Actinokineospora sp. NPDC004072]
MSAVRSEWRRSRRSVNNDCVELRAAAGRVRIRDSKNPGQILDISPDVGACFVAFVKAAAES